MGLASYEIIGGAGEWRVSHDDWMTGDRRIGWLGTQGYAK